MTYNHLLNLIVMTIIMTEGMVMVSVTANATITPVVTHGTACIPLVIE